ncbi:8821_t:CDS:2 [Paraglomus brasilianum]|uniref:8821_t:CDS:1 n=1 Tax=Paraglomus brasilianum TaxID=144538 RepID=A0A9N9BSY9_9GLOM|nr:8821_t:CDS:2 [Paraglomus brasilianum]
MEIKRAAWITLGVVGVAAIAYAFHFDHKRRNDPTFRRQIKKNNRKAEKERKEREKRAKSEIAAFVKRALEETSKEKFPTSIEDKEKYFLDQVAKGQELFDADKSGYEEAAIHLYKALKVYPSPLELIVFYQKTVPEAVFELVYKLMSAEVKKKQEEYWESFPPQEMKIKILPITEPSKTKNNKEKHLIRGVFATNDFNPGDVIFIETPIVCALEPSLEGTTFCSYCLTECSNTVSDSNDLFGPIYCSVACRTKAFDEYSNILFSTSNASSSTAHDIAPGHNAPSSPSFSHETASRLISLIKSSNAKYPLMIARFLARMIYEETEKVAKGVEEEYGTFDHIERLRYLEIKPTPAEKGEIELLRELLASKVPGIQEFISEERYLMLKGKLMYNAYGIRTHKSEDSHLIKENAGETMRGDITPATGAGFYRVASYLTHSCEPNTEITFPKGNHKLSLVAISPIKAGDQLRVSYIPVGDRDMNSRRSELEAKWKFRCMCPKCVSEDSVPSETDDERNWIDEDVEGESSNEVAA